METPKKKRPEKFVKDIEHYFNQSDDIERYER